MTRVQWAQGVASLRTSRYHGIGKIHDVRANGWQTLCGRRLPRRSMRWHDGFCRADGTYPPTDTDYCKRCAKAGTA